MAPAPTDDTADQHATNPTSQCSFPSIPRNPSDLELNSVARSHLRRLVSQSLGPLSKAWEPVITRLIDTVLQSLTAEVIDKIALTKLLLVQAHTQVNRDAPKPPLKGKNRIENAKSPTIKAKMLKESNLAVIREKQAERKMRDQLALKWLRERSSSTAKLSRYLICFTEHTDQDVSASFERGNWDGSGLFDGFSAEHEDYEMEQSSEDDGEGALVADLQLFRLEGGTITVRGPSKELARAYKIIQLAIFAASNLKLEIHLLRDCSYSSPTGPILNESPPRPTPRPLDSTKDLKPPPSLNLFDPPPQSSSNSPIASVSATLGHARKWSKNKLWRIITGQTISALPGPASPSKNKLHKLGDKMLLRTRSRTRSSVSIPGRLPPPIKPGALIFDDWELVAPERDQSDLRSIMSNSLPPTRQNSQTEISSEAEDKPASRLAAVRNNDPHERFLRVIKRMEKTLLSTSPDVKFPPPAILIQLRKQEESLQAAEDAALHLPKSANASKSYGLGLNSPDGRPMAPLTRVPSAPISIKSAKAARFGVDTRTGLASLMTDNNSLEGVIRHQTLQVLMEMVNSNGQLCGNPAWTTLSYCDFVHTDSVFSLNGHDFTMYQAITLFASNQSTCTGNECHEMNSLHSFSFIHDTCKVTIKTTKSDASIPAGAEEDDVIVWQQCQECGCCSEPKCASSAALLYSFGKYMERLVYGHSILDFNAKCEHLSEPHNVIHCFAPFGNNKSTVQISKESVDLFDVRFPATVNSSGSSKVESDDRSRKYKVSTRVTLQIELFYKQLAVRADAARNIIATKMEQATDEDVSALQQQLTELDGKLEQAMSHQADLIFRSARCELHDINSCRKTSMLMMEADEQTLASWEDQHLSSSERDQLVTKEIELPDWSGPHTHLLPTPNGIVLREDEPSSLIAFALSSNEYMNLAAESSSPPLSAKSYFSSAGESKPNSSNSSPEMSQLLTQTEEPGSMEEQSEVTYVASAKMKKHVKPAASLLSLRSLSKQKSVEGFKPLLERMGVRLPTLSTEADLASLAGSVATHTSDDDDKVLEALVSSAEQTPTSTLKTNLPTLITALNNPGRRYGSESSSVSASTVLSRPEITVRHAKASSILSARSGLSNISETASETESTGSHETVKEKRHSADRKLERSVSRSSTSDFDEDAASDIYATEKSAILPTALAPLTSLWGFSSYVKEKGADQLTPNTIITPVSAPVSPDPNSTATPHIKFTLQHGDTKFSVTSWYATKFAELRQGCGISEEDYIDSLSRCTESVFSGGKSKSAFYITKDSRFILKSLITAWNLSERDAMMNFAPFYLKYLLCSGKPSVLTKIFGFYSIKIKNTKTKEMSRLDVVCMEHLFHGQNISRKFDLKGIESRVAKVSKTEGSTLWDADWKSSTPHTRLLIHTHSKTILKEAIENDCKFLSDRNIMDYSLLVGVSDTDKRLTVGLIDICSPFNLAKVVENRSKRALQKGEVTVLPPNEYRDRFIKSMNSGFVASPEKFSKLELPEDPPLHSVL